MKKTIIALMALASLVTAADPFTTETLWTINFGSEYLNADGSVKGYEVIDGTSTYTLTNKWEFEENVVAGGVTSKVTYTDDGSRVFSRPHLQGDTGVDWTDDFQFTIKFTTPDVITANSDWPVIAGLEANTLRFGPYVGEGQNNYLHIDGTHTGNAFNSVALTSGTHTATLTVVDGNVSLHLDGTLAATATIALTGDIKNITLGGGTDNDYRMTQTVHSISMAKVVPEPTTATLSMLALAGLAARRRRK